MNTPSDISKPASPPNKALWAVVGVLGVAVLAMGATLINLKTAPANQPLATQTNSAPAPIAAASGVAAAEPKAAPVADTLIEEKITQKTHIAAVHKAQAATKHIANNVPDQTRNQVPVIVEQAPATAAPARESKPICANCGTVSSVTPIQRDGTGGGGGAIAGGVLGALLGNQVGGGDGKSIATVLGAVGGGFAGNAIEKKMKKSTVYEVTVHMEDGSTRTIEQATPASAGARVIIEGNTLQPDNR